MTKHTEVILYYLYLFRFLNRSQIQMLLGHKHFNRIIKWMNELSKNGYVRQYRNPKIITKQTTYSLGLKGRQYLKKSERDDIDEKLLDRVWREHKMSHEFREHCIFIAVCYLSLQKLSESSNSKLYFYTKVQLHDMQYLYTDPQCLDSKSWSTKRDLSINC